MDRLTKNAIGELNDICPGNVIIDADLAQLSCWRIGGKADILLRPSSTKQLAKLLSWFSKRSIQPVVIGLTTNLLFDDEGLRTPCIQVGKNMSKVDINGTVVWAQAGTWVPCLARSVMRAGLTGAEHISGIPGALGGLICMNGGSQRKSISSNVLSVESVDLNGSIKHYDVTECDFAYRNSIFQTNSEVITNVKLNFETGSKRLIREEMLSILVERSKKFPRKQPNCGSVFKSDPEMYSEIGSPGSIIEKLGFKGYRVGGAVVSPQHANFIVNNGSAKSSDVLTIISKIGEAVMINTGYRMASEAIFIRSDGKTIPADQVFS